MFEIRSFLKLGPVFISVDCCIPNLQVQVMRQIKFCWAVAISFTSSHCLTDRGPKPSNQCNDYMLTINVVHATQDGHIAAEHMSGHRVYSPLHTYIDLIVEDLVYNK